MKQQRIKKLLELYPADFKEKYRDQILDVYAQGAPIDTFELLVSITKENMKRIITVLAVVALLPSAFFVSTNAYFYSLMHSPMPASISAINKSIESPILILGSVFAATALALYAATDFSITRRKNSLTLSYAGVSQNRLAVVTVLAAGVILGIISLYLFVENVGFSFI